MITAIAAICKKHTDTRRWDKGDLGWLDYSQKSFYFKTPSAVKEPFFETIVMTCFSLFTKFEK